jgi:outer membrane protein OmpA-like peptidoglycan-associated protein
MPQFCTSCGRPLQPGIRFCPFCGGAIAGPVAQSSDLSDALSSQQTQFTSVTAPASHEPIVSSTLEDTWTTVAAPDAPEISQSSSQFAPVQIPATQQSASDPSPGQDWSTIAPMHVPKANEAADAAAPEPHAPGQRAPGQQGAFSPVSFSVASSASAPNPSTPNQGWSQSTPPPTASQQWSQPAPSPLPPPMPPGASGQPPRGRSVLPKLLGIALVLILLVGAAVVGGVVYVGYKVRQKARAVTQNFSRLAHDKGLNGNSPDAKATLQGLLGALSGKAVSADGIPILSPDDPVTPCSASSFAAQDKALVPFKPGTILTTAWGVKYGDVEARNSIDSIDESTVTTTNATQEYKNDNGAMSRAMTITNKNCNTDYHSTGSYMTVNSRQMPQLMHDLTRFRLSDKTFQEIKATGRTKFTYVDIWHAGDGVKLTNEGGTLTRVEPQDLKYPMIVNDQRVDLPVIHLKGDMASMGKDPRPLSKRPAKSAGELFVLDDPADPLVLNWRLKDPLFHNGNFRVEVVKINFPVAKPENILEKQLIEEKRAVTYGIYFDFNKDTLKPESEPVLKEIAQAMTNNPDWKLTVEGHTDNIGGDTYNLDLSKRRAASVKQALVTQYNIAPDRLLTGGFGASRPVETNDTLEGRARNRRVELVRE